MEPFPLTPAGMIFDLDGTLLDTEPLYTDAANEILAPFGHTFTMELKRRVMGGDSVRSAQLTIDEFNLPMTAQQFLDQREAHLEALFPLAAEISGAGAFLHYLSSSGIPVGLATSSHHHLCELKIGKRDWKPLFHTIVCGDDGELTASKPDPDIFLLCARRMGIEPDRVVAFEDSRNGVLAAKAAGMFVVALENIYAGPGDLAEADMAISDYLALMPG